MSQRWDRIGHMNRAKARKPASGGAMQKRSTARPVDAAEGSWDRLLTVTRGRWDCFTGDAIEQFRFVVNGGWEGF